LKRVSLEESVALTQTVVCKALQSGGVAHYYGEVSEQLINRYELLVPAVLSTDYREFISKYGAAYLRGLQVYGIDGEVGATLRPYYPDIIEAQDIAKEFGIDSKYIIIGDDGGEGYYAINTHARAADGVCEIDWVSKWHRQDTECMAKSFGQYLQAMLKDIMD
jgi:hypothetical protein